MSQAEIQDARRAMRAFVALSALPLLWKELDEQAIAESLASALAGLMVADHV